MVVTQQQQNAADYTVDKTVITATSVSTTATTTTATATSKQTASKMERRDSTTSDSSVEQLDLGRTPKKLSTHNAVTSTPHTAANGSASATSAATLEHSGELLTTRKRKLRQQRVDDSTDDNELTATTTATAAATTADCELELVTEDQKQHQLLLLQQQQQQQRTTYKRRLSTRREKPASVQLVPSDELGNSLRKKFRFNRTGITNDNNSGNNNNNNNNNESGFVDISAHSSQFISMNASCSADSSPHVGSTSPESNSSASSASSSNAASACASASAPASAAPSAGALLNNTDARLDEHMKFLCPICEVVSATPHEFTNHIRCHNYASGDTENFSCKICSKVLSSASSLDRHVLVHTGERPFNCKYCHLTFTTNGNMHRHMRTHKQHQQNHHYQRRNSNGTKNNNYSNHAVAGNAMTPVSGSVSQLSESQQIDGFKQADSAAIKAATAAAATAAAVAATTNGNMKRRLNGCGPVESYESDGSCSTDSSSANSQSSNKQAYNNNNSNNNNHYHNNNNNSIKINNNLKRKKSHQNDEHNTIATTTTTAATAASTAIVATTISSNSTNSTSSTQHSSYNEPFGAAGGGGDDDDDDDDELAAPTLLKQRRVKTTINNNIIDAEGISSAVGHRSASPPHIITSTPDIATLAAVAADEEDGINVTLNCPVCYTSDFETMSALSIHMDIEHSDIPAKCRDCDVVFRTHRQLNLHPCTQKLKAAVEAAYYADDRSLHNSVTPPPPPTTPTTAATPSTASATQPASLKKHRRSSDNGRQTSDVERTPTTTSSIADTSFEGDAELFEQAYQQRKQFLGQLYLRNIQSPVYNEEHQLQKQQRQQQQQQGFQENGTDVNVSLLKYEADGTKHSHDSKDLADIQSILNITSSSSTSNFLKNFEQSVNTPSSNYSFDKDEEEAQDAFTSEFRKMKLRGEFPCKLCTAVFPNLRALKGHNRVHLSAAGPTGPFYCNMCPYSVCDKAALVRHMRTHNGDRPYECAVCNYAFTTKANCERHLRNRHAKTTRDEVKRAIIYHPSEDSSCDDPGKKLHLFATSDVDDMDDFTMGSYAQHHPKDRSTPVSHLKEMLLAESQTAVASVPISNTSSTITTKPLKIQVKSLEQLLDKSATGSSATSSVYNDNTGNQSINANDNAANAAPIDLSMDVLDLSKKPSGDKTSSANLANATTQFETSLFNMAAAGLNEAKLNFATLAQQQFFNEAYPKSYADQTEYFQQLYRNLVFPALNPFLLHNSFMTNNLNDLQKLAPLMSGMFGTAAAAAVASMSPVISSNETSKQLGSPAPASSANTTMLPQISPLMSDKSSTTHAAHTTPQLLPKTLSSSSTTSSTLNITHHTHMPPTVLPGGPVKMVIKNGVLMPKQKQRRYRTERPFACDHCAARFTLRSNMERHVKQQHPQFYAQRQRSGHHVMRGRGASSAAAINNFSHLQAAFAQAQQSAHHHNNNGSNNNTGAGNMGATPISEHVKYAILTQQLKAHKDTDLLQQALAHGSSSVAPNHLLLSAGGNYNGVANKKSFGAASNMNGSTNAISSIEDDEPKLVIDEDEDVDDNVDAEHINKKDNDDGEDDDDDVNENDIENDGDVNDVIEVLPNKSNEITIKETEHKIVVPPPPIIALEQLPKPVGELKVMVNEQRSAAKKVAETILEQAIKSGTSNAKKSAKTQPLISAPAPPTQHTMKAMIAQASSVAKSLKDVASSSFKDETQDLVPVSKLVDNATSQQMSFNNYFRPSDVANHMEQSDEEGLVASGSASESNNSGTEDVTVPAEPKKKSAYSLAPNRVSCPYCQRMFPWSSSLRRHILTHTGQKPFKCSHCPLLFTTKSNCDRHLLRKHGNVESAMSVYVPTEDVTEPIPVPKSVEEIEQQQRQREEEERRRRKAAEEAQLEHERREEAKHREQEEQEQQEQQEQLLKQIAAAAQFSQLSVAAAAAAAAAANAASASPKAHDTAAAACITDLPFKCHLCESSFGERIQCLEHIKNQHIQEFSLLLAKGAIETDVDPQPLLANNIEEEEREQCATATVGRSAASGGGKYPDYSNRKVICAFCVRRFWSTEDLRRHMRTHSGERPFQCEICLRKFTLKHSMLRHMKKHNGRQYNGVNGLNADHAAAGNSGSDFSDDEQLAGTEPTLPPPQPSHPTAAAAPAAIPPSSQMLSNQMKNSAGGIISTNSASALGVMHAPKIQELLNKANEWRASRLSSTLGEHKENIAEEHNNAQQSSDLIGNLLGISDQGILNKLLSSPDEAAKLLGVDK